MVSRLGSLVQSCCGEGGALQTISLACVGSTRSVPATLGLPPLMSLCFSCLHCSGSRLLSRERALGCVHFPGLSRSDSGFRVLHKGADSVGPAFCAFPGRSNSGSQELDECTLPGYSKTFPLPVPASVSRRAGLVRLVSVLGSWSLAETLPANVKHPDVKHPAGNGPVLRSQLALLWNCSVLPLFCKRPAVPSVRAFPRLILSLLLSHSLSCYLTLAPSDCPQGFQARSSPLRSASTCWWRMRASGVLFCWELLLGMWSVCFIYFSSHLGCPPRFENVPQTCWWDGFLVFENFLY